MANNQAQILANFVDGKYQSPAASIGASTTIPVTSPASGSVIAYAPLSRKDDVDAAVASAKKAFESWRYVL